jgi:HNH endonuclease
MNSGFHDRVRLPLDEDDCWPARQTDRDGYGPLIRDGERVLTFARAAWELEHGVPMPSDLEADHTCANRACGNPRHVEAVPHKTNVRRAAERRRRLRRLAEAA